MSDNVIQSSSRTGTASKANQLNQPLLTVKEVAALIGMKAQTIYLWANQKRIPCYRIGSNLRFDRATVFAWLANQEEGC